MEKLTKEEYEFLKEYEDRLNSATTSQYIRAIPSGAVHKMRLIYSRLIGSNYSMNESCGGCIITLCRKINVPYNEYKQSIKGDANRQVSAEEPNTGKTSRRKKQAGDTEGTKE